MNFDEIIEVIERSIPPTDDTLGYTIDLYDSLHPLGKLIDQQINHNNPESFNKSMINYQVILNEAFPSFQDVQRNALVFIQECYYSVLGAHFVEHNEHTLTIRFITVSRSYYLTGTVEIIGSHYEKLYQEYLEFIRRIAY